MSEYRHLKTWILIVGLLLSVSGCKLLFQDDLTHSKIEAMGLADNIAVVRFDNYTSYSSAGYGVSQTLASHIDEYYSIVDWYYTQAVMEEAGLNAGRLLLSNNAITIGDELGVDVIISGSVIGYFHDVAVKNIQEWSGSDRWRADRKTYVEVKVVVEVIDASSGKVAYRETVTGEGIEITRIDRVGDIMVYVNNPSRIDIPKAYEKAVRSAIQRMAELFISGL